MTLLKNTRSSAIRLSVKTLTMLALSLSTAPVLFAQDTVVQGKAQRSDVVEQRVRYYDLDLKDPHNQLVLVSRVKKAANKVCDIIYSGQAPMMKFESGCTQTVYRNAKPQIAMAIENAGNGTRVAITLTTVHSR